MPGKITELTTLTGAVANGSDLLEAVDISDTSMAATGTNKRLSLTNLIAFLNANGVGASSNEVYVGPNDPIATNPDAELWLDTDAVPALLDDTRWSTAWGVVAMGSFLALPTIQPGTTTLTNPLAFTSVIGRRYRLCYQIRVVGPTFGDGLNLKWTGSGVAIAAYDTWVSVAAATFGYATGSVVFNGTGVASSYTMTGTVTAATGLWTEPAAVSYFYIEDVGPTTVVGTTPQPTAGLEAIKPATPNAGFRFFATDTKREWLYDGTGWIIMIEPVMTYTPALTNVTLGAGGSCTGSYQRSGGWCDFSAEFSLGAGGVLTGQPTMTIPNAAAATQRYQFAVLLTDTSENVYRGVHEGLVPGSTVLTPLSVFSYGALEAAANISSGSPFVWNQGDNIRVAGRYRLNSRYS